MNYKLLILLILANIPVYILYGKMIFKDWDDLCVITIYLEYTKLGKITGWW